jgi:2-dehydropantoate 2-reductase
MRTRSYVIIGAGALGGFYGARLQRAGLDVHYLLHSDYEHVRANGLVIESVDGDFTLPRVQAYREARDLPPCDVVIVALKTTQNHLLSELVPPALKTDGAVLVLQNGLGVEEEVARIVGPQRVLGGLCFLCSNKIGPGHIRHLDYGLVTVGEFSIRGATERLRAIAADFERAAIPVQLAEDLAVARWQKLVWNIPFSGLSVILDATTAELMGDAHARRLAELIMREVVAGANACGVALSGDVVTRMLENTAKMKPYRASMKIDYDERRPMEVEAIFGNPLRAIESRGASAPVLETIYRQLKFLDERNLRASR